MNGRLIAFARGSNALENATAATLKVESVEVEARIRAAEVKGFANGAKDWNVPERACMATRESILCEIYEDATEGKNLSENDLKSCEFFASWLRVLNAYLRGGIAGGCDKILAGRDSALGSGCLSERSGDCCAPGSSSEGCR